MGAEKDCHGFGCPRIDKISPINRDIVTRGCDGPNWNITSDNDCLSPFLKRLEQSQGSRPTAEQIAQVIDLATSQETPVHEEGAV